MIYFLLPAFNEEKNIGPVLAGITETFQTEKYITVLVDDGSTDNTSSAAKSYNNVIIIKHPQNLGLGVSLRDGFEFVLQNIKHDDVLVTLDCDNTHPVTLAEEMVLKIREEGFDIAIASRYCSASREIGVSRFRKFLSRSARKLLKSLFPYTGVIDYTSGYRAYSGRLLLDLKSRYKNNIITESGFAATVEILLKTFVCKPKVIELPLVLRYDLKQGASKIKIVKTVIKYLMLIIKIKIHETQN
jgi:dolichol-phosphate mannosyltransferase